MKYGMKSTRETTIEYFGKRGIGWHGFAVVYYQLDHEHSNLFVLTESFNFLFKFFLSFNFVLKKIFLQGI